MEIFLERNKNGSRCLLRKSLQEARKELMVTEEGG